MNTKDDIAQRFTTLMALIKETAAKKCWPDDKGFMICDYCGGNMDDAYWGGSNAGEILFARRLLKLIEGE